MNIKNEKGFTAVDIGLAMLVIMIFTVIITSISYNVYLSSTEAKRTAVALNYSVDVFEHIGLLDYDDVTANSGEIFDIEALNGFVQDGATKVGNTETITGHIGTFNFELKIEDYNGEDIIKILTLKITFPVSRDNTEKIEIQRLKVKNA